MARLGAVHLAARAAERRRLRVVRLLRRLPGRLHGGQVLHRPAPRRPGPRVRARARRGRAGRARTRGRSRRSATPRSPGTGRRSRCPRPSASARRPAPEAVELAGATWPQVEATGARTVLAVPLGSLEQHGPHLPLDTDTRIAGGRGGGAGRALPRRHRGARRGLRGQRGARRLPGHAPRRPRGPGRPARRARALRPPLLRRRGVRQRARRERGGARVGRAPLRGRG